MTKTPIDFSALQTISEHNLLQLQEISRLNISYNAVKIPTTYDFILIARIAFDLAGEQLAIGAMDGGRHGYVSIWSLKDGEHYFLEPPTLPGVVKSLAWSPDSSRLAAGGTLGHVNIWDVQTRQQIVTLRGSPGPKNYVNGLAFSPDGKLLVSGDDYAALRIFDADTYEQIKQLEYYVTSNIAFVSDGTHFGCAIIDLHTSVANAVTFDITGQRIKSVEFGKHGFVSSVRFSRNNEFLFTHGYETSTPNKRFDGIKIWNIVNSEFVSQYSTNASALAINNVGKLHLLIDSNTSALEIWDWRIQHKLLNLPVIGHLHLALNQQNTLIALPFNQRTNETIQQGVVLYGVPV